MYKKIIKNQARCRLCANLVISAHVHDYRSCKCGEISVDGGNDYLRRTANNFANVEELSVTEMQPAHVFVVDQIVLDLKASVPGRARKVAEQAAKTSLRWCVIPDIMHVVNAHPILKDLPYEVRETFREILVEELVGGNRK